MRTSDCDPTQKELLAGTILSRRKTGNEVPVTLKYVWDTHGIRMGYASDTHQIPSHCIHPPFTHPRYRWAGGRRGSSAASATTANCATIIPVVGVTVAAVAAAAAAAAAAAPSPLSLRKHRFSMPPPLVGDPPLAGPLSQYRTPDFGSY
eukprot:gene24070-biopygen7368